MRIGLITAVWRRPALTAVFWQWTQYLRAWWAPHEVCCFAAGSGEPDHEAMAAAAGAGYVDTPNVVAAKFNAALRLARDANVDAVLVMGSDDVFCERIARRYRWHLTKGWASLGLEDFYYYQIHDGRAGYFPGYRRAPRIGEPTGSGRLVPAEHLEQLNWILWNEKPQMDRRFPNHGNDHGSFKRMQRAGLGHPPLENVRNLGGTALSLKSDENLWIYEHTHPNPLPDGQTAATVLGRLPAPLVEAIEDFRLVPA